jgi:hypothetical protein
MSFPTGRIDRYVLKRQRVTTQSTQGAISKPPAVDGSCISVDQLSHDGRHGLATERTLAMIKDCFPKNMKIKSVYRIAHYSAST